MKNHHVSIIMDGVEQLVVENRIGHNSYIYIPYRLTSSDLELTKAGLVGPILPTLRRTLFTKG